MTEIMTSPMTDSAPKQPEQQSNKIKLSEAEKKIIDHLRPYCNSKKKWHPLISVIIGQMGLCETYDQANALLRGLVKKGFFGFEDRINNIQNPTRGASLVVPAEERLVELLRSCDSADGAIVSHKKHLSEIEVSALQIFSDRERHQVPSVQAELVSMYKIGMADAYNVLGKLHEEGLIWGRVGYARINNKGMNVLIDHLNRVTSSSSG